MMESELKPVRCGCGGEAIYGKWVRKVGVIAHAVGCKNCGIQTKPYPTEAEAVQAWNRAMSERKAKATRKPEAFFYRCECGYGLCCEKNDMNYCPQCGARLEWI